jgi:radical SAM enzyme (TIGR01210 family)
VTVAAHYPEHPVERTRWILARRGSRNEVRSDRAYAQLIERERMDDGSVAQVATIFLTNRECPWKCVMCDLWRNTAPAPRGSIPQQIERALEKLGGAKHPRVLKLYNSGSFFDVGAIPRSDWRAIARLCDAFERVIVECHPRLVSDAILKFKSLLDAELEVALGLETCHPGALAKINKRITVSDFGRAARFLRANDINVRTFLLVGTPFIPHQEQARWTRQSIEAAFEAGSNVVSLIPTRAGNGALEELISKGEFCEPGLCDLEAAQEFGLRLKAGRVFADTWDIERFSKCSNCCAARGERLDRMNLSQTIEARVECSCGG